VDKEYYFEQSLNPAKVLLLRRLDKTIRGIWIPKSSATLLASVLADFVIIDNWKWILP